MNTTDLKAYAPKARRDFIAAVTKQAQKYGVTKDVIYPIQINGDVCVVNGKPFPVSLAQRIKRLGERVNSQGFAQTMEQVAYSWFNRLIAIRYMELNDYLGHGRRVLSHPDHPTGFQILEECTELSYGNSGEAGELPGLTHEKVVELKLDGTQDEQLYRELLLAQCHALHQAMPFLFETIDDETELLLPENLTKTDSLIHDLITDLAESNWRDSETGKGNIEVVGWLYQFYISEKKDEVIGKVVKSEDIPAATQLFTPNWIVKYMVQNSLGAQWLATYPESPLKAQMEYYIEPAEQTDEVNAQLKAITPESLNPEELTLIDPASGSGHILVEAYDLFKTIYLERGYRQRDIAKLILEKNLFGLDIDQRAAQLTGFALMMKGREDDRRLFERGVKLNVMAMVDSASLNVDTLVHGIELSQYGLTAEDLTALKELFEHATTFGSLIQVPQTLAEKLPALKQLSETNSQDMFVKEVLEHLGPLVMQAEILAANYDAVVANPPYMGGKGMNPVVKNFVKNNFPDAKSDLFACFIERGYTLAIATGHNAMVTMQSWMFLSSYEQLRSSILEHRTINNMVHMGNGVMKIAFGTNATVFRNLHISGYQGCFSYADNEDINQEGVPFEFPVKNERLQTATSNDFKKIPGSPIAYWTIEKFRDTFLNRPLSDFLTLKQGLATGENERFLRFWWETPYFTIEFEAKSLDDSDKNNKIWFPYSKGGEARKWFGCNELVVYFPGKGKEIRNFKDENGNEKSRFRAAAYYFKPAITWSLTSNSKNGFCARYRKEGFVFDINGMSAFGDNLYYFLGIMNSSYSNEVLQLINPTMAYQVGDVAKLPIANVLDKNNITEIAKECVRISKKDWDSFETSWDFEKINLEFSPGYIKELVSFCKSKFTGEARSLIRLQEDLDKEVVSSYGLENNRVIEITSLKRIESIVDIKEDSSFDFAIVKEIISYAIGCMMGRYSLDEPGLIYANSGNEGFDDLVERGAYTKFPADDDGIIPLTDKEWFADDAANRLVEFISVAWNKEYLEENLDFLAANLSPKKGEDSRDTIRRYLCDKFYKDHLQTYKKRPIYWLFSSGKQKAFQCLVYLHRYNESTLARMRTEYVIPLTAKLSAHIDNLESDKLASDSAAEIKKLEKDIKTLQKQQTELTEFDDKLKHFADMRIPLDLDEGVKVNYGKFGDLLAEVKDVHGKAVKGTL